MAHPSISYPLLTAIPIYPQGGYARTCRVEGIQLRDIPSSPSRFQWCRPKLHQIVACLTPIFGLGHIGFQPRQRPYSGTMIITESQLSNLEESQRIQQRYSLNCGHRAPSLRLVPFFVVSSLLTPPPAPQNVYGRTAY